MSEIGGLRARGSRAAALGALLALALCGCAQINAHSTGRALAERTAPARVMLMPPDVILSELTAGGLTEPRADWTEAARGHVSHALALALAERDAAVVPYEAPPAAAEALRHAHDQLFKLHATVGQSILIHQYGQGAQLPTKADGFEWTLGPGARGLAAPEPADYALFVFLRDSYATAGRVALIITAALLGVGLQGGVQVGFASLVDLNSGDIVWFSRLISGSGDLRTAEPAAHAVAQLLRGFPL